MESTMANKSAGRGRSSPGAFYYYQPGSAGRLGKIAKTYSFKAFNRLHQASMEETASILITPQ